MAESIFVTRPRERAAEAATDAATWLREGGNAEGARQLLREALRNVETMERARERYPDAPDVTSPGG